MKKVSTSANSALGLDLLRNVCPAEKRTKHSSVLLLLMVRFSAGQTLPLKILHNLANRITFFLSTYFQTDIESKKKSVSIVQKIIPS